VGRGAKTARSCKGPSKNREMPSRRLQTLKKQSVSVSRGRGRPADLGGKTHQRSNSNMQANCMFTRRAYFFSEIKSVGHVNALSSTCKRASQRSASLACLGIGSEPT
jgi:hypothetical protein